MAADETEFPIAVRGYERGAVDGGHADDVDDLVDRVRVVRACGVRFESECCEQVHNATLARRNGAP